MSRPVLLLAAPFIALSLSACTAERLYDTAQAWQRNQCAKFPDKADYDRCMARASTSYDAYKRQTESQ